jgi:hypothetical protein
VLLLIPVLPAFVGLSGGNAYRVAQEDELENLSHDKDAMIGRQDSSRLDDLGLRWVVFVDPPLPERENGRIHDILDVMTLCHVEAEDDGLERHHDECLDAGPYQGVLGPGRVASLEIAKKQQFLDRASEHIRGAPTLVCTVIPLPSPHSPASLPQPCP